MGRALAETGSLEAAAQRVLQRVKAAALGEALLDAYGDRLILELWRERQAAAGQPSEPAKAAGSRPTAEHQVATGAPGNGAARAERRSAAQGTRRVDVAQLASDAARLEQLVEVEGHLVRLGDLDKQQCRVLQRQHETMASAFGKLADELVEGQTVRQRWTAEQLEDLVGDTFRAASARPTRL
jgi:chemotaxis protein histidine kinase CheA